MPARVALARLLRRVRRRMRVSAGLEGAVVGVGVALVAWGVALLAARWGASRPGPIATLAGAGLVALAALAAALRRIPLVSCARAVDRAVPDGERNGDRVLAALSLMNEAAPGPFVDAAIEDAARAARAAGLASAAAPLRRPRGLGVVATLAVVIAAASLWPTPRAPAAAPVMLAQPPRRAVRVDPASLAAERAAVEAAAKQAAALDDAALARLAAKLSRMLDALAAGKLEQGEALERLARLEREASLAAEEGRAASEMIRAAAEALDREAQTRALADALREQDGASARKAAEALGEQAKAQTPGQREKLARSLARAGEAGARALDSAAGRGDEQRRLGSDGKGAQATQGAEDRDRRLKRLDRDLSDAAEQCRQDPEACRQAMQQMGADLPEPTRDARQSSQREKLGRTTQHLRERLRRQNPRDGSERAGEESFERAAGGLQPMPAGGAEGDPQGDKTGKGAEEPPGSSAPGSGETASAAGGGSVTATAHAGDGMGTDPGEDPLGARDRPTGARGQQHEARVRDGEGPSRAEVIEAGAHKGFARTEYQRVFQDYSAVVEETLDTTAVPAPRRYLVRRYFQLIRPRDGREAGSTGGARGP